MFSLSCTSLTYLQYERFWAAPMDTPIGWIAYFLSMLSLASQVEYACAIASLDEMVTGSPPRPQFLHETVQCLVLADYMNGGPYIMEALINYQIIEHMRYPDASVHTWILFGTILRIALRMGYHRDPSHFPNISAFQGEMRRRIFVALHAMDVMLSLQVGLPRLLKDGHCDTQPPRNLEDHDFGKDTLELPPSRPESQVTLLSHFIAKHRILTVVGVIADTVMSVSRGHGHPSALAAEKGLASRLQETYDSISDKVKLGSFEECKQYPATEILHRLSLDLMMLKGLIMLHWHHVVSNKGPMSTETDNNVLQDSDNQDYRKQAYKSCVKSALRLLDFQSFIDWESRPGGALFIIRSQVSSVPAHDFSMATIVLVANMYRLVGVDDAAGSAEEREETETALRRSHAIWVTKSAVSKDAAKVTGVLDVLFEKLDAGSRQGSANNADSNSTMLLDSSDITFLEGFGLLPYLQDLQSF